MTDRGCCACLCGSEDEGDQDEHHIIQSMKGMGRDVYVEHNIFYVKDMDMSGKDIKGMASMATRTMSTTMRTARAATLAKRKASLALVK